MVRHGRQNPSARPAPGAAMTNSVAPITTSAAPASTPPAVVRARARVTAGAARSTIAAACRSAASNRAGLAPALRGATSSVATLPSRAPAAPSLARASGRCGRAGGGAPHEDQRRDQHRGDRRPRAEDGGEMRGEHARRTPPRRGRAPRRRAARRGRGRGRGGGPADAARGWFRSPGRAHHVGEEIDAHLQRRFVQRWRIMMNVGVLPAVTQIGLIRIVHDQAVPQKDAEPLGG